MSLCFRFMRSHPVHVDQCKRTHTPSMVESGCFARQSGGKGKYCRSSLSACYHCDFPAFLISTRNQIDFILRWLFPPPLFAMAGLTHHPARQLPVSGFVGQQIGPVSKSDGHSVVIQRVGWSVSWAGRMPILAWIDFGKLTTSTYSIHALYHNSTLNSILFSVTE